MSTGMDPFWVPPDEFGPPRELNEIADALRDVTVVLGLVVRACHAVRPRVNMRPTVRELHRMRWQLLSTVETLNDAQQLLEDDAPLAVDFPNSDQVPWWSRENPLLSPRQLIALHKLALPEGHTHGVTDVGPLISYRKVLAHTEAEPHHIVDHHRRLATSVENVLKDAEDLIHPALAHCCPRCTASPHEACRTPSGAVTRTHKARTRLAVPTATTPPP